MPLVLNVPGLVKADVEMVSATFAGEPDDNYMLARMFYDDKISFDTAMKSEQNRVTAKDLQNFASAGVSLFVTHN